jgi:hypothetical protein
MNFPPASGDFRGLSLLTITSCCSRRHAKGRSFFSLNCAPEGVSVKALLNLKSGVELLTGLAIAMFPSKAVWFLFGAPLDTPGGVLLARFAGVALLTLGISCWFAGQDSQSRTAVGLVAALLLYDVSVVAIFLFARFSIGIGRFALWPAIMIHSALGIWSAICLGKAQPAAVLR